MHFWKRLFGHNSEPQQHPVVNASADARGENRSRLITKEKKTFVKVDDLLKDLLFRVIPNTERASENDIHGFNLMRQVRQFPPFEEAGLESFQGALYRLLAAVSKDFKVQQWELEVDRKIISVDAI